MPLPPEIPYEQFVGPNSFDRVLVQYKNTALPSYTVLQPLQPHPDLVNYAGFVFVAQVAVENDDSWVRQVFVNDRIAQDASNSSNGFSHESNNHPLFPRSYIVRRLGYAPRTKLLPLTGVVAIVVTAGGSGYVVAPTISFTGGAGSGATALAVVFRGALVGIVITAEGSGWDSATPPTVVITAHASGGTGATATASIQPKTALLVKEAANRMEGDPLDSLFFRVERLYKTLPGVPLVGKEVNEWGALNTTTTTEVASGTVTPANGLLVISDETKPQSSVEDIHSRTVAESWPTLFDYRWDEETQSWIEFKYEIVDEIISAPSVPAAGIEIEVQKINNQRSLRITRTLNGGSVPTGRNEVIETDFVFPAILISVSANSIEGANGEVRTRVVPNLRSAFRKKVNLRVAISYSLTEPSTVALNLLPNSIYYPGFFFSLNIPQVLNNEFTLTYTTGTDNPQWPEIVEEFTQGASSPTASSYVTDIGSEKAVSSTKKKLPHFQLWRLETAYLTLQ